MNPALLEQLMGDSPREALSELTQAAKKKAERQALLAVPGVHDRVRALLKDASPKVRKNAARLLGAFCDPADGTVLAAALENETTLFTLPSLLLALGSVGGESANAALAAYTLPAPKDETEVKHVAEIADALRKAREAAAPVQPIPPYRRTKRRPVLCTAPEGFSEVLLEELTRLGFSPVRQGEDVLVATEDWTSCCRALCAEEFLLPLGENLPCTPQAVAKAAEGELTLPYRIELRNYTGDRNAFIRDLTRLLPGQNSPSRYGLELRIEATAETCRVRLKPTVPPDGRFPWRKRTLPASMAPALAECLGRLAYDALSPKTPPRVLDPFCGSGTLLFAWEQQFPAKALLGVDIAGSALTAARENAASCASKAKFTQKDILRFLPGEPFDLILTNLPFGNRVGTHENNESLYRGFVRKLPELLAPGGVALLYTMEYRLLKSCLAREKGLALSAARRTEAGGLLPWVFVVQRT